MSKSSAQITELTQEIDINATPDAVWRALTSDIGSWWPAEFYAGGVAGKRRFIRVTDDYLAEKDKGWNFLWALLKARLEGTALPVWQE